jgi:RNA polymerase sigma-70 factor (ECF subfamily)
MAAEEPLLDAVNPAGREPTDSSLLRRLRTGNQDAATQLYVRYAERVRGLARAGCSPDLARRIDADDIVQSVFTSFFRGVGQGYYSVPAGDELWKLLLVIALNKIRARAAFHRAAKRDVRLTAGAEQLDEAAHSPQQADDIAHAFLKLVIDEAMASLPPQQREMIRLRIESYEVAEIAARTKRSKRTVERVLQEFRTKLANTLREENGPDYSPGTPEA